MCHLSLRIYGSFFCLWKNKGPLRECGNAVSFYRINYHHVPGGGCWGGVVTVCGWQQCCGSGSGSGSADPCLWLMDSDPDSDPDPVIFVIHLQDANHKLFFFKFSAYYFMKVHLHHFSKIKSQKEVIKQWDSRFFLLFMLGDRRIRIRIRIHTSG